MKKGVLLIVLMLSLTILGQSKNSKWAVGVSGSLVTFGETERYKINEQFNLQLPRVNVSRYLFSGLTADLGVSFSLINKVDGFFENNFNYFAVDGMLRYDFGLSGTNMVPYVAVGGSMIGGPKTISGAKTSPTLNFGLGTTFWITNQWGANLQAFYKKSPDDISSMYSHYQFTVGVVYSLKPRKMLYRLWEVSH